MGPYMSNPEPIGKVETVHPIQTRVPDEIISRFSAIHDLTSTVSDAMDGFGISGAVPASVLRPTIADARIVGTAITVKNVPQTRQAFHNVQAHKSGLGEMEAHNLAQPGDVIVIEGIPGVSAMGGISTTLGARQGEIGAVVDGGIRDLATSRELAFPIWSRDVTPITGKWRVLTTEINGTVTINGISVRAGDLVVADETGVCFVPSDLIEKVLARCEEIVAGEAEKTRFIQEGVSAGEIMTRRYEYSDAPKTLDE